MGWSTAHLRYAFKPANGAPYWPHRRRHLQQVLLFLYKSFEPPEEFFFLILLARARNTNKFFLKKRCHVGPFFFFVQLDRKHSADTLDGKVVNFPPSYFL